MSDGGPQLYTHPAWASAMPWLTQGTTAGADMSLFGGSAAGAVLPRWLALRASLGCTTLVHARQVHGADVLVHDAAAAGVIIAGDADGHATTAAGLMLTVSVADCVPIAVVAPERRVVALLHGGWRGVAAGILDTGIAVLDRAFGAPAATLHIHLGPAICGACFQVGPEVPAGLGIAPPHDAGTGDAADDRAYVDLRAVLAGRAIARGVPAAHITTSSFCTRCGDSPFFSHRAGCAERQISLLGIRAA
jgi:polyphenol oxidase